MGGFCQGTPLIELEDREKEERGDTFWKVKELQG